jgi:hypothetical protein
MADEPSEAEVRAAARAICTAFGQDPDALGDESIGNEVVVLDHLIPRWMRWKKIARAALVAAARARRSED